MRRELHPSHTALIKSDVLIYTTISRIKGPALGKISFPIGKYYLTQIEMKGERETKKEEKTKKIKREKDVGSPVLTPFSLNRHRPPFKGTRADQRRAKKNDRGVL